MADVTSKIVRGNAARTNNRWNLAIVSEGFRQDEMAAFDSAAAQVAEGLLKVPPFSAFPWGINIFSVAVPSKSSAHELGSLWPGIPAGEAAKDPRCRAVPPGYSTPFGARFCQGSTARRLYGDSDLVIRTVRNDAGLNFINAFLVLVNSDLHGGAGPRLVAWTTLQGTFVARAVHELGHSVFDLRDEYNDAGDGNPPRTYTVIPIFHPHRDEKNVTTRTMLAEIPWKDLVTAQALPTTKPAAVCQPDKDLVNASDRFAVGLFEGADHYTCGIYRPESACRMEDSEDNFLRFCRVCDRSIRLDLAKTLSPRRLASIPLGNWTHVIPYSTAETAFLTEKDDPRLLTYDSAAGKYSIYRLADLVADPANPRPLTVPALRSIDPLATSVVPFMLDDTPHFLWHEFATGRQSIAKTTPDGADLVQVWSRPIAPGPGLTHVVPVTLSQTAHYLGYNAFTGEMAVFRFGPDGTEPTAISAGRMWAPFQSAVVPFELLRSLLGYYETYVLLYQWTSGKVEIRRLSIDITKPAPDSLVDDLTYPANPSAPVEPWVPNQTHVTAMPIQNDLFLLRYSALDGWASFVRPRALGTGTDYLWGGYPRPEDGDRPRYPNAQLGIGGMCVLGVGAPAFGSFSLPPVPPDEALGPSYYFWFYNAAIQKLSIFEFA